MGKTEALLKSNEDLVPGHNAVVPHASPLREKRIDLAKCAEKALIKLVAGDDQEKHSALKAQLDHHRAELAGPNPSPLEKVLVERVVINLYQVNLADMMVANDKYKSLMVSAFMQRRQDSANRRFLQSAKTLAEVRRLLGPNIQVNIAEKQINLMGAGPVSD